MKFMCKYCNKSYSCGKALGGHLSSHKMSTTDYDIHDPIDSDDGKEEEEEEEEEDEFGGRGCLGKKVKRSGTMHQGHFHHVCKECGKGFKSLKALCGHMACHSEKERPGSSRQRYESSRIEDKQRRRSFVDDGEECSETVADSGQMQSCRRSKRVRCMNRAAKFADGFSFISGTMTIEEVAKCLMMMSNDRRRVAGCWGRVGDHSGSLSVESEVKPPSSGGYSGEICFEPKQAYKKLDRPKTLSEEKQRNERKSNNNSKHECPICFREFKSGQAMGGHKRSHFLGSVEEVTGGARTERGVLPKVYPLIDLNFPAFLEEGEGEDELLPW